MKNYRLKITIPTVSIHLLMALIIILWLNVGNSTYVVDKIPSIVKLGIVMVWFALASMRKKTYISRFVTIAWPMLMFLFVIISAATIGHIDYYRLYFQSFLYILILIALFTYYFYFGEKREIKIIVATYIVDTAIVTVRTFIELLSNPIVARAISTGGELKQSLLNGAIPNGIGGYGLCYALVFFMTMILLLDDLMLRHSGIRLAISIFVLLLLFEAQLTVALVMYVLLWIISIVISKVQTSLQILMKAIGLAAVLAIMINMTSILEWAINIADTSLASRLSEILIFFQSSGTDIGSDAGTRIKLYTLSINNFAVSPLWGSWGSRAYGCHSSILDMLAAFGMIGFTGIYGIIRPVQKAREYLIGNSDSTKNFTSVKYLSFLIGLFLFFSCINVSHGSEIMVVFILITPLTLRLREDCF